MDYQPESAKRDATNNYSASNRAIEDWATEQLEILKEKSLNPFEQFVAASALSHFKVDPRPIAMILVCFDDTQQFMSFTELVELMEKKPVAFIKSEFMSEHVEWAHDIHFIRGCALIKPLNNSNFLSLKMTEGKPEKNYSLLSCLHQTIIEKGKKPIYSVKEAIGYNNYGHRLDALLVEAT